MNEGVWIEIMIAVSTVVLGGGITWLGGRLTRVWDGIGVKIDETNKKIDVTDTKVEKGNEATQQLVTQVNRIEDRVMILWAERTGSRRVDVTLDRNDDRP